MTAQEADSTDTFTRAMSPTEALRIVGFRVSSKLEGISERISQISDLVRSWSKDNGLRRSIMIIDDSAPALCALVNALAPVGVPIHAVTQEHDENVRGALLGLGAVEVHVAATMGDVAALWAELRCEVVVSDVHLGDGVTGLDVLAEIGRGPQCFLVTSHEDARTSVDQAARLVQARGFVRTDTGAWQERLRAEVSAVFEVQHA